MSERILGNEKIRGYLDNSIRKKTTSHAYILAGDEGTGKTLIAKEFAIKLICEDGRRGCMKCRSCRQFLAGSYPDFFYIDAGGKESLGIDKIREEVVSDTLIRPYQGKFKIYVIDDADRMTAGAQNALLKTIEEPPEYVIILLLVKNTEMLLETVRSRCIKLVLAPVEYTRIKQWLMDAGVSEEMSTVIASYSNGAPGVAKRMAESKDFADIYESNVSFLGWASEAGISDILTFIDELKKRDRGFRGFLDFLRLWYRDILTLKLIKNNGSLIFVREEGIILRLSREYTLQKINNIIDMIDEAQIRLNSNVSGELVMELVLMGLKNGR